MDQKRDNFGQLPGSKELGKILETEAFREGSQDNSYDRKYWFRNAPGIDVVLGEYVKGKIAVTLDTA